MRKHICGLVTVVLALSEFAHAQYINASIGGGAYLNAGANFGVGSYMGGYCPYPNAMAPGASDESDEVYAKRKAKNRLESDLRKAKREQELAKSTLDRQTGALKKRLSSKAYTMVETHISNTANADQWRSACDPTASSNTGAAKAQDPNRPYVNTLCGLDKGNVNWYPTEWLKDGGEVDSVICSQTIPQIVNKSSDEVGDKIRCEYALKEYGPARAKYVEATEKVTRLQEDVARAKIDLEGAQRAEADRDDDDTEGTDCQSGNCPGARRRVAAPSNTQIITGGVLAALGGYFAYRGGKYAIDRTVEANTSLGWPTTGISPYWSTNLGLGMLSAGIGGMMGGGGALGCAGGWPGAMGPGGAFGYPGGNMMGPGGMWMPGMGPNGNPYASMMGPYGNMMGNPMMMGNMMGNPMMNPMMMGNMMGNPMMQMQQLQQQMAMQQYQQQMQQQYMQDYMYRQQAVYGLQQQMYQIQLQIYQISSGGMYSGGYGSGGYGSGPSILPYPGYNGPGTPVYGGGGTGGFGWGSQFPYTGGSTYNGPGTPVYSPRTGR
ncbi:MAG: hypothetical protein AB7N80_00415 [Bdellovibrionales bacterium]